MRTSLVVARRPALLLTSFLATAALCACSASSTEEAPVIGTNAGTGGNTASGGAGGAGGAGGTTAVGGGGQGGSTSIIDVGGTAGSNGGDTSTPPTTIYANTDKALYQMDPVSKEVTLIGEFSDADGVPLDSVFTDVAVSSEGKVWACSTHRVYELTLPEGGTGPVIATERWAIPGSSIFYALGMAPRGVLGPNEELVGGDGAGYLYQLPSDGGEPIALGGFGDIQAGDPYGTPGEQWALSGDVVFFSSNAYAKDDKPIGLATIRPVNKAQRTNDVVVEIDMDALAKKSAASNLKKRFVGESGTGVGSLFGIGAWDDKLFAFRRYSGASARFYEISLTDGRATELGDFPDIAAAKNGWSGAGVSTSAKVVLPPVIIR